MTEFEELMAQATILVKHRQKDAITYIGAMKTAITSVTMESPVS